MTDRRSSIDDQRTIIVRICFLTFVYSLAVYKYVPASADVDDRKTTDDGQTVVIRITERHSWIWDPGLRRRSNKVQHYICIKQNEP